MIKILTDECVNSDLVSELRKIINADVKTAVEVGLSGKDDQCVFDSAVSSGRILITFDRGFGDIFRFDISKSPGIVVLLVFQMKRNEVAGILVELLNRVGKQKNFYGKLIILGKSKARIIKR